MRLVFFVPQAIFLELHTPIFRAVGNVIYFIKKNFCSKLICTVKLQNKCHEALGGVTPKRIAASAS
jgi:hypothetical protein